MAFTINLWGTWSSRPTPSPVSPAASFPARCSSFSTIFSAPSTVSWDFRPLMSTTAPMPQASCSKRGLYNGEANNIKNTPFVLE